MRHVQGLQESRAEFGQLSNEPASFLSPERFSGSPEGDSDYGHRPKRRKIGNRAGGGGSYGVKYGHYGQVMPGRLRMDLVSCNGGIHDNSIHEEPGSVYRGPENILKHDKSVYCSKYPRCNLILRHLDEAPFSLEKLYIIAPEGGYTAPIQEGLVFVSMESTNLADSLSNYNIQYTDLRITMPSLSPPPPPDPPQQSTSRDRLTFLESLNDPEISAALQRREELDAQRAREQDVDPPYHQQTIEDWYFSRRHTRRERFPAPRAHAEPEPELEPNYDTHVIHDPNAIPINDAANTIAPCDHDITVTVTYDEDGETSSMPEDPTPPAVLTNRARRDRRMRSLAEEEEEYGLDWRYTPPRSHYHSRYSSIPPRRQQPCRVPLPSTPPPPTLRAHEAGESASPPALLRPHARFFVPEHKHKAIITFDPPVSGRFIALRIWSPYQGRNVDVQTVVARGFSGP
ncbi:hypothetical protein LTR28_013379, partial [Elasticomyces elasticus]